MLVEFGKWSTHSDLIERDRLDVQTNVRGDFGYRILDSTADILFGASDRVGQNKDGMIRRVARLLVVQQDHASDLQKFGRLSQHSHGIERRGERMHAFG